MNHRYLPGLVALFLAGLCLSTSAGDGKIRVLIVDGFSNHDWRQTTAQIRGVLAPTGLFDVSVSTAPGKTNAEDYARWRPKFSDYQVVIQTCNDIGGGPKWPEPVKKDFADFVRNGGGVYIFHSAENAFVGWKEYEEIVGLCWRKKDYGTAMRVMEDGQLVRIPPGQGWLWPVEWTVQYGQGRVYVSTFGHVWKGDVDPETMRCAAVQTIIPRALQWLAGRPVTFPVPADFPGTNAVSVRSPVVTSGE